LHRYSPAEQAFFFLSGSLILNDLSSEALAQEEVKYPYFIKKLSKFLPLKNQIWLNPIKNNKNDIKNLKFPDHFVLISRSKQVIFIIMSSKFNDALELIESLTLEEQEELLEIERKRLSEKKRKLLLEEISDAEKDITNGNYLTGTPEELVKAIEEESKGL